MNYLKLFLLSSGASDARPAQVTTPSMYAREYGRNMHKRATIELLLRGRTGPGHSGAGDQSYSHPHR